MIDKTPAEDKLANGSPGPQMLADLLADLINKPIEELISQAVNLPIWRRTPGRTCPRSFEPVEGCHESRNLGVRVARDVRFRLR